MPFGELKKDTVLSKGDSGGSFFVGGGSSSHTKPNFYGLEADIIANLWDNDDWFVDAELKHIDIIIESNKIIIEFDPIDLGDAQTFAKGIKSCLNKFYGIEEHNYIWKKFKGFTIRFK